MRKWVGIWFAMVDGKVVVGTPRAIENYRKRMERGRPRDVVVEAAE